MMGLTPMQARTLQAVRDLTVDGVPPSYRELMVAVGLKGEGGIQRQLHGLKDRGALTFEARKARSIRLTSEADRLREFSDDALLAEVKRRGLHV